VKSEIISIGTEILLGQITDTNSSYLASQLPLLGIDLYWVSQVGDNKGRMVEVIGRAWGRSDLIITTGGLGPTEDDVTREAIAEVVGEDIKVDPTLLKELEDFFRRMGYREMPPRNIKQAHLIPSAQPIPNPRGTAPGWWVEKDGKIVLAMPGPPGEMERMWQKEIIPRLKERMAGTVIASKTLKTFGISEAKVDEMVSPLLSSSNPTIGIYAKPDGIQLRLTAKAETQEKAEAMLAPLEQGVRAILGSAVWGVDEDTLEAIIGTLLVEKGLTLATMESCTGGLLATTITDVPGSSRYFRGGLVSYSNEMKVAWGVDAALIEQHGAVSPQVAEAMALAVRSRLGADIGIGITGVAGPDELEGKRAGTVHIAVLQGKDGKDKRVLNPLYPPRRPDVKRRATVAAIIMLRQLLLGLPIP